MSSIIIRDLLQAVRTNRLYALAIERREFYANWFDNPDYETTTSDDGTITIVYDDNYKLVAFRQFADYYEIDRNQ